jgi:hypothetical protein
MLRIAHIWTAVTALWVVVFLSGNLNEDHVQEKSNIQEACYRILALALKILLQVFRVQPKNWVNSTKMHW